MSYTPPPPSSSGGNLPPLMPSASASTSNTPSASTVLDNTRAGTDDDHQHNLPAKKKQKSTSGFDKEAAMKFYMTPGKNFSAFAKKTAHSTTTSADQNQNQQQYAATPNPSTSGTNRNSLFGQQQHQQQRRLPSTVDTPSLTMHQDMGGVSSGAASPFPQMMNLSRIDSANTTVVQNSPGHNQNQNQQQQQQNQNTSQVAVVSGLAGIRNLNSLSGRNNKKQQQQNDQNNNNNNSQSRSHNNNNQNNNNAASPEYLQFLRQQQDLLNLRGKVEKVIAELKHITSDQESYLDEQRVQGEKMLHEIEASSNWNLRSKYDVKQLAKDCGLTLLQQELLKDEPAEISHLQALYERLHQLTDPEMMNSNSALGAPDAKDISNTSSSLNLFVENAVRRISVILDNLKTGNANCTHVAKASEPVITLLHTLCTQPTVEAVVTPYAKSIDQCVFELEKARKEREVAYQDGEINSAEGLSYDIVEAYEAMLEQLMVKLDALEKCQDDARALTTTREQVSKQTEFEMDNLFNSTEKMRKRCEDDINKTFALRDKVEEVETQTSDRMESEQQRSDQFLQENNQKLQNAFVKLQETFDEIENLERERHRELQRRLTEKDKDEHRRAEYAQFIQTVDEHIVPLERTLKNMVLVRSATDDLRRLSRGAFTQIDEALRQRESILNLATTEAHKQHVEAFRGYLIELGDVVAKKERMIEEVDDNIQQAIAQKEILTETFNPAAKKFGDIKRKLLASRDELEQDVVSLKQRAGEALERFQRTEDALNRAGVAFVHPVVEQEHHAMEVQAKLMQYKALAVGHTEGNRLMDDIGEFRHRLGETKREVATANSLVSGTIGRTIPLLRAAAQQQQQRLLLQQGNNNNQ